MSSDQKIMDQFVYMTKRILALKGLCREQNAVIDKYFGCYPAFRMMNEGAPGSQVRIEQEKKMAIEDSAKEVMIKFDGFFSDEKYE